MKAINIFFLISMMIVAHSITAQDGAQGTTFGVIGGVNYFNLVGDDSVGDAVENDALLGFQGGVFMRIPLAN